jgi:hypothetical protein
MTVWRRLLIAVPVLIGLIGLFGVAGGPAHAQEAEDPFAELQRLVGPPPAKPAAPAAPRRPATAPAPRVSRPPPELDTSYTPNPYVRQQVQTMFTQLIARTNPQRAQIMAGQFANNDVIGLFDAKAAKFGLRPNHVADAMAAYCLVYWTAATNYTADIPRSQAEAVRAQIARVMAPTFTALDTDAKRQMMAEFVILKALNLASLEESARKAGNIPAQQMVANMAEAEFQTAGIDLRSLDLLPTGFKKRY